MPMATGMDKTSPRRSKMIMKTWIQMTRMTTGKHIRDRIKLLHFLAFIYSNQFFFVASLKFNSRSCPRPLMQSEKEKKWIFVNIR